METQTTTRTRITLDPSICQEVAERIVYESHPGHGSHLGTGYTDGHELWIAGDNRPWDPWPDGTAVIDVLAFVDTAQLILAPLPQSREDWAAAAGDQWTEWEAGYRATTPDWAEDAQSDGTPDYQAVLEWARAERTDEVDAVEAEQEASAVEFALSELAQAVELEMGEYGFEVVQRIY